MTAIADMKLRIIGEMNRDDMGSGGDSEQRLIDAYTSAINFYASELFWFNRLATTAPTIANTATVALPSGMRCVQVVTYLGTEIPKVQLEAIEAIVNTSTAVTGPPSMWAEDEGAIHLYPTPDAIYSLGVYGIADLGVPASSNEWVVSGQGLDLIVAETKLRLYRGTFRDIDGAALSKVERDEALANLRRDTRSRATADLRTDLPMRPRFNINIG